MTTASILAAARRKILELTTEVVTDATLYEYGSQAQLDIGRRAFPSGSVKTTTVTFLAGVGTKPTDFGTLYGDAQENAYNVYPEMSQADFARNLDGNAITVTSTGLMIYPATSTTLTIRYWPSYTDLSGVQDPTIDPYFHELIVYGILYRVFEDLQDEELSKYYRDKYEEELKLKTSAQSNYEEGNQRGGQMFNGIQIISE